MEIAEGVQLSKHVVHHLADADVRLVVRRLLADRVGQAAGLGPLLLKLLLLQILLENGKGEETFMSALWRMMD